MNKLEIKQAQENPVNEDAPNMTMDVPDAIMTVMSLDENTEIKPNYIDILRECESVNFSLEDTIRVANDNNENLSNAIPLTRKELVHVQKHNFAMPKPDQELFPDRMKFKDGHLWVLLTTKTGKQMSDKLLLEKIRGEIPGTENKEKQVKIDFKYLKRRDTPFKFWTNLYEHPKVASKMILGLKDKVKQMENFLKKLNL
jgi:hypothetical protein